MADMLALASRHVRLYRVPVVVLTPDPVLGATQRIAQSVSVTLVAMPFDVETLRCVMRSVAWHRSPVGMGLTRLHSHEFKLSKIDCPRACDARV